MVHDEIENWIKNRAEPKDLKSINGKNWLQKYQTKSGIEFLSEVIIYSKELKIAGTIDILAKDNNTGEYIIIDCYRKIDPTQFTDVYNDVWYCSHCNCKIWCKEW